MELIALKNLLDLTGKTAIVTGAVGIGYGISYRLAEAGARVVIASRDIHEAEESVAKLKAKGWVATPLEVDVTSEESVTKMVQGVVAVYGGIDILVNNAGIYPNKLFTQMTLDDFEKVIAVNLKGVFLCTKYVAEQMIKRDLGGKIINVSSIDAIHPSTVGLAHYDASKHGVWGFTKSIALELAPHKIWVNALAPGGIMTEGAQKAMAGMQVPGGIDLEKMMEAFLSKIPIHRMGEPDDIGKVALFLASSMSDYMTGEQVVVDGGVLLS
jgi:2-deoxy-D-gluconate 3-dehydrogenase